MRLVYADALTTDGAFVLCDDGPVTLVRARARRTDISRELDLTLPVFPMSRSGWKPLYERDVFYLARLGAECAYVLGVPFGPGDHEDLALIGIPESILNDIARRGAALIEQSTKTTIRPPRVA